MNPFKIIIVILILAVVGGSIALATGVWNPSWNPFNLSSEDVVKKMIQKMADVKTASSEGEMYFGAQGENPQENFRMDIALEADSDTTDLENQKSSMEIDAELLAAEESFSFSLQAITIGQTFYLNITSIPEIPEEIAGELALMGIDLNQFLNQWIKIDEESLKNFYQAMGMDPVDIEKAFSQNEKYQEISEELSQELIELMEKRISDLLNIEVLSDEEIEGVAVYHYKVVLDKEGLKIVIPELIEIFEEPLFTIFEDQQGEMLTEQLKTEWEESKEKMLAELDGAIDELFEKTGEISAELWIGKQDYYLYKIKADKSIDFSDQWTSVLISFGFDLNFSNFNQPMTIEVPLEYKGFDEIFLPIIEMMMMQSMMMSTGGVGVPEIVPAEPSLYPMLFLSPLAMSPSSEEPIEETWSHLLRASLLGIPF